MARIDNVSKAIAMILACGLVLMLAKPSTAALRDPLSPPSPEPKHGFFNHIKECANGLNKVKCGQDIITAIFETGDVSDDCCRRFVSIKKSCSDDFVSYVAHGPDFVKDYKKYWAKYESLYHKCSSISS
jgi:hypothetical protein